ncbi:MAG: DUF2911 domain-containing protein [Gemmatimonadota bacterium]
MRRGLIATVAMGAILTGHGAAQAPASPRDTTKATIGAAKILVDYGRPSKRGRVIFADAGLVPFGQVWRAGANAATTFVTNRPLMFGATMVPAGTYTLYAVPNATGWKLVINKQTGQWGTEYHQDQDLGRVDMKVEKLAAPVEKFAIKVEPKGPNGQLRFEWDTTAASVDFMAH